MKVLSLFDGLACGAVAFTKMGIPIERYVAYEIDKYAIQIATHNFPYIEERGDVFAADFTEFNGFDWVIGGSPCTYWSVARSATAKHERETISSGLGWNLFLQYLRALREAQPKYFLYENNYTISKDIQNEITKQLGVEPIMINSGLVSAQNRKRLYWTNVQNISQPADKAISFQDVKERDDSKLTEYIVKKTPSRIRMWNDGNGRANGAICCDNITNKTKTGTVTSKQDRNYNAGLIQYKDFCRYLTIEELEKLQTLPTGYTNCGIPKSARQLAIGNGWTVDVIVHLIESAVNT